MANNIPGLPDLARPERGGPFVDLFGVQRQTSRLRPLLEKRIAKVLDHARFILGPEVHELEERLSELTGCHVVTVSSGRDALLISLIAEGIHEGHSVAVPAFTFPATAEAVVAAGGDPVFVDVHPNTWTMDPADLERQIRNNPFIEGVIAVDIFGLPADYEALERICHEHGKFLIADAAQSFGGTYRDKPVGSLADTTCFSFYPTKPLGCAGDGGAIATYDSDMAKEYRLLRSNGIGLHGQETRFGASARLDTIQAAILLCKLDVFDEELERRQENGLLYDMALSTGKQHADYGESARAVYTIRCGWRDQVMRRLAEAGVMSRVYYEKPLHHHPAYRKYRARELPVAERLCREVLSIPVHPYLTEREMELICEVI